MLAEGPLACRLMLSQHPPPPAHLAENCCSSAMGTSAGTLHRGRAEKERLDTGRSKAAVQCASAEVLDTCMLPAFKLPLRSHVAAKVPNRHRGQAAGPFHCNACRLVGSQGLQQAGVRAQVTCEQVISATKASAPTARPRHNTPCRMKGSAITCSRLRPASPPLSK